MRYLLIILSLLSFSFSNDNWNYAISFDYDYKWSKIELKDGSFIRCQKLNIDSSKVNYYIKNVKGLKIKRVYQELSLDSIQTIKQGHPNFFSRHPNSARLILIGFVGGLLSKDHPRFEEDEDSNSFVVGMMALGYVCGLPIDYFVNKYSKNEHKRIKIWKSVWNNKSQINNSSNKYDEIEKLFNLKEQGIITDEEFEKKKKEILGL